MIHHNEFWWRFFPKKELTRIYASTAVRNFAISLIGIFIPLYLHVEQGISLQDTLLFFIFYSLIFAITAPLAAKFASYYGAKHSIFMSVPFYLAFVVLLYALPFLDTPLVIISSLLGLSQSFYWMGMHLVFHHASDHDHRGEEVSKRVSAALLAGMAGPFAGGFLITYLGFKVVFALASLFLLLSALILLSSKDGHARYHFSVRSIINRKYWKNSLFFVSQGTRVIADGVIWPLFIFIILNNYLSLGIIGSILSGLSAVLLLVMGKYSDRHNKRKIARWASLLDSLSWILRGLVTTVTHIYAVTILAALTTGFRESPLGALEYDKAEGEVASYFVSREVFICLGRILMLTFVLMLNSLSGGLIFQGAASLAAFLF